MRRGLRLHCVLWLLLVPSAWGQTRPELTPPPFPENVEARLALQKVVEAPVGEILAAPTRTIRLREPGRRVQFRVDAQGDFLYLQFLNERSGTGEFPVDGSGSFIIKRSRRDGSFQQLKIFYRNQPGSFVRVFPDADRSRMDVYLFGRRVYGEVILPAHFDSLLFSPFERIVRLSGAAVSWPLLLYGGEVESDRRVLDLLATLRGLLPALHDREDGAQDERGRFVRIADLAPQEGPGGFNCSGFAKWIVDGFYAPIAGRLLPIETLKDKPLERRGNGWSRKVERERDPYFGLDWSRNLAVRLMEARLQMPIDNPEAADIRQVEFFSYVEDMGYPLEDLELALFLLAARQPGTLYIGSVNNEIGEDPALRQHFHLAVLFPHFFPDGTFRVRVMERNQETSLAALQRRYPKAYIHLVRLEAGGEFVPPSVE
jgi:hypothetical protein